MSTDKSNKQLPEIFEEPCQAYYEVFTDKKDSAYKYRFLSPFEFKNTLVKLAIKSVGEDKILDASRGAPNFFATIPRYAFALLVKICTLLGDEDCQEHDIAYIPNKKGLTQRFDKLLYKYRKSDEAKFLKEAVIRMRRLSGMKKDIFMNDLVISALGCAYPDPPRIQKFAEPVLAEFLDKRVYKPKTKMIGNIQIFPTEGAANAILYIFNTLKYNGFVIPGDTIGILTPIFSPYLEIPTLENYNLKQVCIKASDKDWELPDSEIEKIGDPNMKALFLVNPTNPTGYSLSSRTLRKIAAIVRKSNPYIIIIEDNVYAPFADEFNSFFNILPKNTIGVYSLSKYFGVTGWRLGTITIHNSNIIDSTLLKNAPSSVNDRYRMLTTKPEKIKFIDRLVSDSRQVSETHVAGLSTPQQTQMCLFAMYDLIEGDNGYRDRLKNMLLTRMNELSKPIKYQIPENSLATNYYTIIDIRKAADGLLGGSEFGNYIFNNRDPFEFLMKLAKKYGTVLLAGVSFAGPFWGMRVSLANLEADSYRMIGENIRSLIDEYYLDFKKWDAKQRKELLAIK